MKGLAFLFSNYIEMKPILPLKNPSILLVIISIWLIISSIYQGLKRKNSKPDSEPSLPLSKLKMAIGFHLIGSVCLALGIFKGASLFLQESLLHSANLLAISIIVSSLIDAGSRLLWERPGKKKSFTIFASPIIIFISGIGLLGFVLFLRSVPGANSEALQIQFPIKGKWRVVAGGRTRLTNYHYAHPESQNYAVDFVIVDSENSYQRRSIFAPVDGTVIRAVNNFDINEEPAEGNFIVIQTTDGIDVWLAHLEKNSLRVDRGDYVKAGQEIAACGASGSAAVPHLHIHAQHNNIPIPMVFGAEQKFPVCGDIFEIFP